ncbi:MAG: hypothetical protein N838_10555 [Thiohalocapsa sp. PB-PSB1]|nr:MAG: hypothetical protein N838_10555 [Thiohalocapsa sp. PB-PSB1]
MVPSTAATPRLVFSGFLFKLFVAAGHLAMHPSDRLGNERLGFLQAVSANFS